MADLLPRGKEGDTRRGRRREVFWMMPLGKIASYVKMAAVEVRRFVRASSNNAATTLRRLRFRLSRPVSAGMPPVWTPQLTQVFLVSLFAVLFAAVFDPYFVPVEGPLPSAPLRFFHGITDAAKSGGYIVPAVIVIAILGLADWRGIRHATRRTMIVAYSRAAYILVAIALPGILVNVIKQFAGRARPYVADESGVYAFHPFRFEHAFQSFPSGHATTAGSLALILMIWYPQARGPLFLAMAVLASTRIPAGAHYPSDVAAGFTFGAIMALVIARWLARRRAVFGFRNGGLLPVLSGR